MTKLQQQMNFLFEIDKLKSILRQSVVMGDINRRENDAEHSWHFAMCAIILKEYVEIENVDMEKVIKMALIHDLVEIYGGDTPAFSNKSKELKFSVELEAAEKIFGMLPENQYKKFLKLWLEFENMETDEAIFANIFDRFQGFMLNLTSDGHTWKKWNVTEEKVLKRLDIVIKYAPAIYKQVIRPEIDKYIAKGIIKTV